MLATESCSTRHSMDVPLGHWLAGSVSWLLMVYRFPDADFTAGKFVTDAPTLLGLQVTVTGSAGKNPWTRQAMTTFSAKSLLLRLSGKTWGLVLDSATQDAL